MVKKTTIGKIQLWVGIIILLASIISIFLTNNFLDNINSTGNESMELKTITNIWGYYLWTFFSLTILISLLFMTQGLINMKERKLNEK